jgi:hypothetical protein
MPFNTPEKKRAYERLTRERYAARAFEFLKNRPLYKRWAGIKTRCYNASSVSYPYYGGRGILMCDQWRNSYEAFEADMLPSWQPGLTLDRIDNDGPYSPQNCRWATRTEQMRNMRGNVFIDTPWGSMTLADAAIRSGIDATMLGWRLKNSKPLFTPVRDTRYRSKKKSF